MYNIVCMGGWMDDEWIDGWMDGKKDGQILSHFSQVWCLLKLTKQYIYIF